MPRNMILFMALAAFLAQLGPSYDFVLKKENYNNFFLINKFKLPKMQDTRALYY